MKQKISKCMENVSARIIIEDEEKKRKTLSVFDHVIKMLLRDVDGICSESDGIDNKLLLCGKKKFFASQNIVHNIKDTDAESV